MKRVREHASRVSSPYGDMRDDGTEAGDEEVKISPNSGASKKRFFADASGSTVRDLTYTIIQQSNEPSTRVGGLTEEHFIRN